MTPTHQDGGELPPLTAEERRFSRRAIRAWEAGIEERMTSDERAIFRAAFKAGIQYAQEFK